MASMGFLNNTRMRDLITCSVCLEVLEEPKVLPCLHSFCTLCLQGMWARKRLHITCPICKDTSRLPTNGISGLRSDFKAEQMKEILEGDQWRTQGGTGVQCEVCQGPQNSCMATLHCTQCEVFYCQKCIQKHADNSLFRHHKVTALPSGSSRSLSESSFCTTHPGHRIHFLCCTCRPISSLCAICVLHHDVTHDVHNSKDAAHNFRLKFRLAVDSVKTSIIQIRKQNNAVEKFRGQQEQALNELQEAICLQALLVTAQVDDRKTRMIQELQAMSRSLISNLKDKKLNAHLAGLIELEADLREIIDGPDDDCLAIYEELAARIQSLDNYEVPDDIINKGIRFIPNRSILDRDVIGTLEYFMHSESGVEEKEQDRRDSIVKTERSEIITRDKHFEGGRAKIVMPWVDRETEADQKSEASSQGDQCGYEGVVKLGGKEFEEGAGEAGKRVSRDENDQGEVGPGFDGKEEGLSGIENVEEAGRDGQACGRRNGTRRCESCNNRSGLISFYSKKKDRLLKLCRHCRALSDVNPDMK